VSGLRWSGAAFKSPAVVAGLDDVAVVSETIEQRRGHFGVSEDARPFAEGEIGGDDDRGSFVQPADEMEEELAAGLGEGQIAEFIEDDEVHAGEVIGEPSLPAVAGFGFQPIDEIDDIVEPTARAGANAASRNGDGEMGLAGSGRSSDILPGIRGTDGFIIRFIRDVERRQLSFGVSVSKAETFSSFINLMGRWRIYHAGC